MRHILFSALMAAAGTRGGSSSATPAPAPAAQPPQAASPPAAAAEPAPAAPAAPAFKFTEKRRVTLPVFKLETGVDVYVRCERALYEGKEIKGNGDNAQMKPATLLDCVNLATGELGQIVAGTVLASVLRENYPNDGYVGKSFRFRKLPRAENKRYNAYDVVEIEAEAPGK